MARFRFARRAAEGVQGDAGRPSGETEVLAFCREIVSKVSALEPAAQDCLDEDLRDRTRAYRERLRGGETARVLLPEAFATVREAARRAIGLRHHDVQIMGGAALHLGMIAEMRTGEGKTLTATLPAYVAALSGQPVHVMTANDYLATRDRNWMQPVYQLLGLTTGLLEPAPKADIAVRRAQYDAVADEGGLCVLGTERTGDRRTELHLRGRAGRQGDPGESLFYLSAEDEIAASMLRAAPKGLLKDGAPFGKLSQELDKAQLRLVAAQARWFQANVAFDDVLAAQQRSFYADRRSVVDEPDMRARLTSILDDVITAEVEDALRAETGPDDLARKLARLYPVASPPAYISVAMQGGAGDQVARVLAAVRRDARQAYDNREAQLGERLMRDLERRVLLAASDRAWREHLAAMSDLLSSLQIRAAGGTPPLAEYQREAAALYTAMASQIRRTAVRHIFYIKVELQRKQG